MDRNGLGQLKTEQSGKGMLQSRLWCLKIMRKNRIGPINVALLFHLFNVSDPVNTLQHIHRLFRQSTPQAVPVRPLCISAKANLDISGNIFNYKTGFFSSKNINQS